jgi:hypothetical protein
LQPDLYGKGCHDEASDRHPGTRDSAANQKQHAGKGGGFGIRYFLYKNFAPEAQPTPQPVAFAGFQEKAVGIAGKMQRLAYRLQILVDGR